MEDYKIPGGYVLLARSVVDSDLFHISPNALKVAIYLLLEAQYTDSDRRGVRLERGTCWKTISIIAEDCNVSIKAVRCALSRLEQIDFIQCTRAQRGARRGHKITICNYNKFQHKENYRGAYDGAAQGNAAGQSNVIPKGNTLIKKEREQGEYTGDKGAGARQYPRFSAEVARLADDGLFVGVPPLLLWAGKLKGAGISDAEAARGLRFYIDNPGERRYFNLSKAAFIAETIAELCKRADLPPFPTAKTETEETEGNNYGL